MHIKKLNWGLLVPAVVLGFNAPVQAEEGFLEEVIVTAQRIEQSLQDVPLAVSAFSADALAEQQIETMSDLQLATPSLQFAAADGRGGSFAIRGITNLATSATADSGVEVHVNDIPMGRTTAQDGEFFDLERVEVLRGPQGTLFGRNSVGGAINMITARPNFEEFSASIDTDFSEYGGQKIKGHLNLQGNDYTALRIAYQGVERDGLADNIYSKATVSEIDNRSSDAFRVSLGLRPTDQTFITIVYEDYSEDSTRNLRNNTFCKRDPSFVAGCTPGADYAYELTHPMGTYVENLMVLSGLLDYTPFTDMSGAPQGFYQVNMRGTPTYEVEQDSLQVLIEHELTENLMLNISGMTKDRDFDNTRGYNSEEMQTLRFNDDVAAFPGGLVPLSGYGPECSLEDGTFGVFGGCVTESLNYPVGYDRTLQSIQDDVFEIRMSSSFEGSINFILGGIWSKSEGDYIYDIPANGLDALSLAPPAILTGGAAVQLYPGLYRNASLATSESEAVFGEIYYLINDRLRLTAGLRHTRDEKSQYSKLAFLNAIGVGAEGTGFTTLMGSLPGYGDAYRATTGTEPTMKSSATTGRVVLDYSINDSAMTYFSISTGFKGGGFNPALDAAKYPNTSQVFPNMEVISYEIGLKSEFREQGLRFNAAAYYYDTSDYHVTKIVNKTNVNEGIDVDLWGVEADVLWAPNRVPGLEFNIGLAWETSEIAGGEAVQDPINPDLQLSGGSDDWHMMKDEVSEVFIAKKDAAAAIYQAWLAGTFVGTPLQGALIPAEFHGDRTMGEPTPVSYLTASSQPDAGHLPSLAVRAGYEAMATALGYDPAAVITDGLNSDVGGNSLTHPDLMANVGVQYTMPMGNLDVTARLDYYYQSEFYSRIFNLSYDELASWSEMNAQITIRPQDSETWTVAIYGQNITDEQNIMSLGLGSAAVGFTRGIAAREPRVFGVRLSYAIN